MAECNVTLVPYSNLKPDEKVCKYSYSAWCPTCDRDSPRRRTKSETLAEPCRRKGKEMKTFTPKKYDRRRNEYENMDTEYEVRMDTEFDVRDLRLDRIRSNLCELPTTYITNNCQAQKMCVNQYITANCQSNANMPNVGVTAKQEFYEFHKLGEDYEKPAEADFGNPVSILEKMAWCEKTARSKTKAVHLVDGKTNPKVILQSSPRKFEHAPHRTKVDSSPILSPNAHRVKPENSPVLSPSRPKMEHSPILSPSRPKMDHSPILSPSRSKMENSPLPSPSIHRQKTENSSALSPNTHRSKMEHSPVVSPSAHRTKIDTPKTLYKTENSTHADKFDHLKNAIREKLENPLLVLSPKRPEGTSPRDKYDYLQRTTKIDEHHFDTTCTFFDKPFNPTEVRERYCKELEILREKLKDLRNHKYSPIGPPTVIKNLDKCADAKVINTSDFDNIKIIENVTSPKIDGRFKFSEGRPVSRSRISVKTKGRPKSVRSRPKIVKRQISINDDDESDAESDEGPRNFEEEREADEAEKSLHVTTDELVKKQEGSGDAPSPWPIRESLFPHIPPYIKFNSHDKPPNNIPTIGRRHLKWKLSTITPIVVRKTLVNTGFRLVRKSNEWTGTWGKHMKSPMFKTLKNSQKLNHFAGTFQIGRKDRLWKNLQRLMYRYGTKDFGITPHTYVLPQDLKALKQNWTCKDGSAGEKWIIKPPASARGVGIKVINKWAQLPKQTSLVVQRYIADPYLINGSKFDLRLYVLVTSFDPLRIYLYPEGLVRFASVKYSCNDNDLKDRYMHLTNYSINKLSSQYTANEDANACQGHKWTLSKLWEFMEERGLNTKALWKDLQSLVIKTMISGESPIAQLCSENVQSRYNCYELFGVDVLLDQRLKPWLLEVNISPSLHSTSPLDLHVKGPLVQTLFDIAQFHLPPKLSKQQNTPPCYDYRVYATTLLEKEASKHEYYLQMEKREDYLDDILDRLTGDDVRILTRIEDELVVKGNFERIFPTSKTHEYLEFMPARYYNRLCDAWEHKYENNRLAGIDRLKALCAKKLHLKVAPQSTASKNSLSTSRVTLLKQPQPSKEGQVQADIVVEPATDAEPPVKGDKTEAEDEEEAPTRPPSTSSAQSPSSGDNQKPL